ncbi:SDR family NAD(P)-dependent oxidoreductase [Variovorax sp. PBS-H4]|uniref:SDR family NAD(P)-dependent oxidoreductase n=1 Tax=Variovorax sp. PBS-H4 TaxID=434008 RepID=UPI0013A58552|nr:SDR family NAD(P)-dependent oxidoreductase [Variovorax sp. PBS-H4]
MTIQRSAVVTGGASGIGLAIAKSFIAQGWRVLLVDVSASVTQIAEDLSTSALQVHGHRADLSAEAEVLGTAAAAKRLLGGCDVLVNCAGVSMKRDGQPIPPLEVTTADWQRVLFVNLTTPFLLCRELIPGMKEKGWGRVINITSRAGRTYVQPAGVDYAASKAGLVGLTRHLGGTFAPFGVTVNCIAPGRVETPLSSQSSPEVIANAVKGIPVGRLGTTEEIAAAAQYLASDAASYITGFCLDVNGGAFIG